MVRKDNDIFLQSAKLIEESDAVVITAGAGIGVDSGLPDFRGNVGFWKAYPPIKKLGISFVAMANPTWFFNDPDFAWGFYGHRLKLYRNTEPHQGFHQLYEIAQTKKYGYFVFTSNVDGQFQKAGYDDERIVECHGSIHYLQCTVPCSDNIWQIGNIEIDVDEDTFRARNELPRCKKCGSLARPNILMFGDAFWLSSRTDKQELRFRYFLEENYQRQTKMVVIEIGAGTDVPTVRLLSESIASHNNVTLIRINPRDPATPKGNISIKGTGLDSIKKIYKLLKT